MLLVPAMLALDDALVDGRIALQRGDYAKAHALLEPLASAGKPRAEFYLSLMYQDGLGARADPSKAHCLQQQAAKAGDSMGQYNLANQGLVLAQHNLGSLCALGKGVPRDLVEAAAGTPRQRRTARSARQPHWSNWTGWPVVFSTPVTPRVSNTVCWSWWRYGCKEGRKRVEP